MTPTFLTGGPERPVIRRLCGHIVDLIAAGEVVERPASALKELVENAIDAGATRVDVLLRDGGRAQIEVTDNGCGMTAEELLLAVERHCTSKLPDDQLIRIRTLGFRGEALPSIGASARLSMTSRVAGAEMAWRLRVDGGIVTPPEPASGLKGTHVVVKDLFFATPARRKFLKTARVESGHAETVMRRLALAAPHCSMRLVIDDHIVFDLPVQTAEERAGAILEVPPDALIPLEEEREEMRLSGYACGPAHTRATGSGQFILVNDRPVTDPALRTAIRVAYRPLIERGRFPLIALHLSVPAEKVDVNVHPTKTELRFADETKVRAFVIGALGRALERGAGGREGLRARFAPSGPVAQPAGGPKGEAAAAYAEADRAELLSFPAFGPSIRSFVPRAAEERQGFSESGRGFAQRDPQAETALMEKEDGDPAGPDCVHPLGVPIVQIHETYILAIAPDGNLILVDQHAAHERLTHERLREQFATGSLRAQALLLPEVIDLPSRQKDALLSHREALSVLGMELESFGPGSVLLRSVPALLATGDIPSLLRDVADELASDPEMRLSETESFSRRLEGVIARMACHGSIRAGRRLKIEEMEALLREMEHHPRANTCPHGRPTWLRLTRAELERLFGRIK